MLQLLCLFSRMLPAKAVLHVLPAYCCMWRQLKAETRAWELRTFAPYSSVQANLSTISQDTKISLSFSFGAGWMCQYLQNNPILLWEAITNQFGLAGVYRYHWKHVTLALVTKAHKCLGNALSLPRVALEALFGVGNALQSTPRMPFWRPLLIAACGARLCKQFCHHE